MAKGLLGVNVWLETRFNEVAEQLRHSTLNVQFPTPVHAGFEVIEAASADEAMRIFERRSDIRVVFTDIQMPGSMDGLKLAHAVRDRWPPIKIIVTSGREPTAEQVTKYDSTS